LLHGFEDSLFEKKKINERGWIFLALALMVEMSALSARAGVLEDVRIQFNKDKGSPRLVLLVSPT
jgi:hypothetical protein